MFIGPTPYSSSTWFRFSCCLLPCQHCQVTSSSSTICPTRSCVQSDKNCACPSLIHEWQRKRLGASVKTLGRSVGFSVSPFQVQHPVPSRDPLVITGSVNCPVGPGRCKVTWVASCFGHSKYPSPYTNLTGFAFIRFSLIEQPPSNPRVLLPRLGKFIQATSGIFRNMPIHQHHKGSCHRANANILRLNVLFFCNLLCVVNVWIHFLFQVVHSSRQPPLPAQLIHRHFTLEQAEKFVPVGDHFAFVLVHPFFRFSNLLDDLLRRHISSSAEYS